jgi:hypothetical protein
MNSDVVSEVGPKQVFDVMSQHLRKKVDFGLRRAVLEMELPWIRVRE